MLLGIIITIVVIFYTWTILLFLGYNMNDKLIELAHLCLDIYDFELTNNPKQRGGEVSQFRKMVYQREAMIKELSEERFNLEKN